LQQGRDSAEENYKIKMKFMFIYEGIRELPRKQVSDDQDPKNEGTGGGHL
jgi:hypothetical protein